MDLLVVIGRSVLVALLSCALGHCLAGLLRSARPRAAAAAWVGVALTALTPTLVIGQAHAETSIRLSHVLGPPSVLLGVLLVLRLAPVAALVLFLLPATGPGATAARCAQLAARGRTGRCRIAAVRRGAAARLPRIVRAGVAAAVTFLLAFGEFELTSMLGVESWTTRAFDAQVGGLSFAATLLLSSLPVGLQLGVALAAILGATRLTSSAVAPPASAGRGPSILAVVTLSLGSVVLGVYPLGRLLAQARGAWGDAGTALWPDVRASTFLAATAAATALVLARPVARRLLAACASAAPGSLGSLTVALGTLAAFQLPLLRALRDTAVPLLVAHVLLLLPVAVLVLAAVERATPRVSLHAATLLLAAPGSVRRSGRRLRWRLSERSRWWLLALLFHWAYFELAAASLLAPAGSMPVVARLHDFMHYGRTPALAALVLQACLVPLALVGLLAAVIAVRDRRTHA